MYKNVIMYDKVICKCLYKYIFVKLPRSIPLCVNITLHRRRLKSRIKLLLMFLVPFLCTNEFNFTLNFGKSQFTIPKKLTPCQLRDKVFSHVAETSVRFTSILEFNPRKCHCYKI